MRFNGFARTSDARGARRVVVVVEREEKERATTATKSGRFSFVKQRGFLFGILSRVWRIWDSWRRGRLCPKVGIKGRRGVLRVFLRAFEVVGDERPRRREVEERE